MVRSKEELIEKVKMFGDSDEVIELIEDISDTLDEKTSDSEWKEKYEELDKTWRKKYIERFSGSTKEEEEEEKETYEDLFEEVEK